MPIIISSLIIYPIKSCGGVSLSHSKVVPGGLQYDRRYMLIDSAGMMITQRTAPRLSLVTLKKEPDSFCVSAPKREILRLSLAPESPQNATKSTLVAQVWHDVVQVNEHLKGSSWFSSFLGSQVRLIYLRDEHLRPLNARGGQASDRLSLADAYPLLLCSNSSLSDLNQRMKSGITMARFRPNVAIEGAPAYAEDTWASLALNDLSFRSPKLCDRCTVTTIDPETASKLKEPLKTLAQYRKWGGSVWFGTNIIPSGEGLLTLGDELTVLSRRSRHPGAGA